MSYKFKEDFKFHEKGRMIRCPKKWQDRRFSWRPVSQSCQYLLIFDTILHNPPLPCGNYISPNSFQFHIFHRIFSLLCTLDLIRFWDPLFAKQSNSRKEKDNPKFELFLFENQNKLLKYSLWFINNIYVEITTTVLLFIGTFKMV